MQLKIVSLPLPDYSVISGAAARLVLPLEALRQRLAPSAEGGAGLLLTGQACKLMTACLTVAHECGVGSAAVLQLAQAAFGCLVSSGRQALAVARQRAATSWGLAMDLHVQLKVQMQLALLSMGAVCFASYAAEEMAPPAPAQLAAWLAAVVDVLKLLGEDRRTGGQSTLHPHMPGQLAM